MVPPPAAPEHPPRDSRVNDAAPHSVRSGRYNPGSPANSRVAGAYARGVNMGLDQHVVDTLIYLARQAYPDWQSFADERTVREERGYKLDAVQKAIGPDGLLLESALRQDLEGRAFNSFYERFKKIGQATNLLYLSTPSTGDLSALHLAHDAEPEVFERFCWALLDLLWGDDSSPDRLGRYLSVLAAEDLPSKWTFPTYFLFLTHPNEDLFIKTDTMRRLAKELKTPWTAKGSPTAEEYGAILAWSHELRDSLEPFGAQDMIDVQSLLWIAGSELASPKQPQANGHWKIAPGPHGSNWATCSKEGAHISVGWDELGDLSKMTREEFESLRDGLLAAGSDHTVAGCEQAWKFAHDIAVGDEIVANQGISRILGFGRVTGPYHFVPDGTDRHRLPVEWFDTAPRQLASPRHDWQRTLAPLDAGDFDALLKLPPEQSALAPPFDKIFADRAEAEWAFGLLADTCAHLGVESPADPRIALMLPYGGTHLHLNFANWLALGFEPLGDAPEVAIAILTDTPGIDRFRGDAFKSASGATAFCLKYLPRTELRADASLKEALGRSQKTLVEYFAHMKSSSLRRYHVPELADAVFDDAVRDRLLTEGLENEVVNPAFTVEARDLLRAMTADPTKAFYAAHKDELTQHVQEPVQQLLKETAARIAPTLQEALEATKKLFGVFPKNDWGKGGAWPYYWGAFYPLGGKKTEGCQLYVFLDEEGFSYGFSIGSYASEDRKRFAQNAEEYRSAIVAALGETVNTPDFEFGNENESAAGHVTKGIEGLDLAAWLEQGNKVGPHVHVLLAWAELLGMERERVVTDVVNAFNRLFPLVLLGTMDEPMPAIRAYMEDDIEDPEVNPPYALDDLVAETSLPKKNLEAWLRAIARKGQAILYGPPGTGKTYVAERLAKHLVAGGTGTAELVQFHPAYAYEDFMQGMRPKARDGGGLDYPVMDGRFKQFCDQARGRKGLSVLIIDEVNRANLARVFGELMYLLEYRDKSIPLAAGGRFSIPANVRLIGTMNTANRSIALVDHALRRRFAFLPLYPDYQMLTDYHAKNGGGYDPAKLVEVLKDLNRRIGDHHYEVGTSFFMRPDIAEQLPDVWSMEIEPYLEEYFFDQQGIVDSLRWDEVKNKLGME